MRIVAGTWRGRTLIAPPGRATRPTADRVRQALFDMLLHAPWGGREVVEGVHVLDAFAGTGALGLEALSRGAAQASFMEPDRSTLVALQVNIAACRAGDRATILVADATRPPGAIVACGLVFLDPPYGQGLVPRALAALRGAGWLAAGALIVAETGVAETFEECTVPLAVRDHGAARLTVWRSA